MFGGTNMLPGVLAFWGYLPGQTGSLVVGTFFLVETCSPFLLATDEAKQKGGRIGGHPSMSDWVKAYSILWQFRREMRGLGNLLQMPRERRPIFPMSCREASNEHGSLKVFLWRRFEENINDTFLLVLIYPVFGS